MEEAQMNRIAQFFKGSIINKAVLLIALILISVNGILAVNTLAFFNVKNSLESMIDHDIGQIIDNAKDILKIRQAIHSMYND